MTGVQIQAPVIKVPPEIQQPGVQVPPQAQPPLQGPPLRTPQQVLAESQQRFPQVSEQVLRGETGQPGLTGQQTDMLHGLSQRPVPGLAPVVIGQDPALKVALMPTAGVPGPNPGQNIQQYVKEGQALHERIMNGENVPHGKEEVAKVMWFLQALGSAKASESSGQHPPSPALFKEGAFSLEDPHRHLEHFLSAANSYPRQSSHLNEFQGQPGCKPRGVDIRGVPMPNGRKTVLFTRMPGEALGGRNMLFLKMEPHGCRGFSLEGTGRAGDGPPSLGRKISRFFANLADTIGHAFGFFQSVGQQSGAVAIQGQNNRERIPGDVKTLYADLKAGVKALAKAPLAPPDPDTDFRALGAALGVVNGFGNLLDRNAPLSKTGGIRVMLRNLEEMRGQFRALPPNLRAEAPYAAFGPRLDAAITLLRSHGDHPELRFGNEIILTTEEMNISDPIPVMGSRQPAAQAGTIDQPAREMLLAGYRYILANIDQRDKVNIFENDSHRSLVHVGPLGQEADINRDTQAARASVLALADGDERTARALMTLANQSLARPIAAALLSLSSKSVQALIQPGNTGEYHISRLPDAQDGAKVFRVGFTCDGPMGSQQGLVPLLDGTTVLTVDQDRSRVSGEIWLDVTFHPNGVIEPAINVEPACAFTFVPAAPQ